MSETKADMDMGGMSGDDEEDDPVVRTIDVFLSQAEPQTKMCVRSSAPCPLSTTPCSTALRPTPTTHTHHQPNSHTSTPARSSAHPRPPNRCVFQYPLRPKSKPEVDAPRAAEVRFRYEHEMAQMEYDVETEGANYDQHAPSVQQAPRRRLCSTTVPLRTQYGKSAYTT